MSDKILATVNGKAITEADIDGILADLGERGRAYQNPQGRAMILEQQINRSLLVLDATRNLYEREPEFKAELAKVKEELLASYAIKKVIADIKVKDEDVKKFYEENKEQFKRGETVNASHILVDSEEKCNEILAKINADEITFEDAAMQFSSCPSSQKGGCLGDFTKGQMVPEFDSAVFSMNVGEITGPVKTQFGFHLIKLNSKSDAAEMTFEEVEGQIKQQLYSEKQQAAYQSKINQLKILFPVDINHTL